MTSDFVVGTETTMRPTVARSTRPTPAAARAPRTTRPFSRVSRARGATTTPRATPRGEDEGRCQRSVAPRAPASFASTTRVGSRRGRSRRGDAQVARFLKRLLSRDEDDGADEEREGEEGAEEKPEEVVDATSAPAQATSATASSSSSLPKVDMKTTLSDLDALLGIDTEAEAAKKAAEEEAFRAALRPPSTDEGDASSDAPASDEGMSISPQALEALKAAEAERRGMGQDKSAELEKMLKELGDKASQNKALGKSVSDDPELQASFNKLVTMLEEPEEEVISPENVERIKKEIFGMQTFYVTSVENLGAEMNGAGVLFKGNLRTERAVVWETLQAELKRMFKDEYTAFMLEEPLSEEGPSGDAAIDSKYGPRVSFLIVPSDRAGPSPDTSGWQYLLALALMALTVGSAVQLGLVAEISKLPPETMSWLQQAGDVDLPEGVLPPGLEDFDSVTYVEAALPITIGVMAASVGHEIGHQIAAFMRKIKIGVPFLIPNSQLGTFGTLTQIKSTPETRADLFDVAAAGPLAGSMVGLNLFVYGLTLSVGGDNPDLIPIPDSLFNTSLLLGGISQLFLDASTKGVLVHPYFIAGWCALTTQALNLLPVGSIDGGRMAQTAFGRRVLGATSLGTYISLSFGIIASSLALPWAIYIVLTQRTPEFSPKDDVTQVDDARATLAFAMIAVAFLILLPGPVDVSDATSNMPPF